MKSLHVSTVNLKGKCFNDSNTNGDVHATLKRDSYRVKNLGVCSYECTVTYACKNKNKNEKSRDAKIQLDQTAFREKKESCLQLDLVEESCAIRFKNVFYSLCCKKYITYITCNYASILVVESYLS